MAQPKRIVNLTRGLHWKFRRAEKAVYECACKWEVYGESVRDLTLAESIAARNVQAANREPLAHAEIRRVRYVGPIPTNWELVFAGDAFAASRKEEP